MRKNHGILNIILALIFGVHMTPVSARAVDSSELPSGGTIVGGSGEIISGSGEMRVNQYSSNMTVNWDTFNIGTDARVQFVQPGASSVAINNIFDASPSQILGSLSANGQVFLLNSAGIIFGWSAQVDVGGLVASSLRLSQTDFDAGHFVFENSVQAGDVLNHGNITGGYVALLSHHVINEGNINSDSSAVALIAADKVSLDFSGDSLINYTVDKGAVDAQVKNSGLIAVDGGLVVVTARARDELTNAVVNNTGVIEATSLVEAGGRIILDAGENGQSTVTGVVDASSEKAQGGRIVVTGDRVLIEENARLLARGATGGGEIYVGGGWQGADPAIGQAVGTVVSKGALLDASATDAGNGGTVVAWSDVTDPDSVTRAYGTFLARGGVNGGDGGRIETSGNWLDISGISVSAQSPRGSAGIWLLDPNNINIQTAGPDTNVAGDPAFVSTNDTSILTIATLLAALDAGTNVSVSTSTAGANAQGGDITVVDDIANTADNDATLTLNAHRDIVINGDVSSSTHKLNIVLNADSDRSADGAIIVQADIATNGGNVKFGADSSYEVGTVFGGAGTRSVNTNGGDVAFFGDVLSAVDTSIVTNNGAVTFNGKLDAGNTYSLSATPGFSWAAAVDDADNAANSYMVTITSSLENSLARSVAAGNDVWTGGYGALEAGTYKWRWKTGPEGQADSGQGLHYFSGTNGASAQSVSGVYNNWGIDDEGLNGSGDGMQIWYNGGIAKWDDTTADTAKYYIRETEGTAAAVTINAGASGVVTFADSVGSIRALSSLNVTADTIAVNGGAVTTGGVQSYNGDVTLGSATTTFTQLNADTDFTLPSGKSITNSSGADSSLTIKTTGSIIMDANTSIGSPAGKLNTVLWSDSDASSNGHIFIYDGNTIDTNGGNLVMAGGLDDGANSGTAGDGIPDGFAFSTVGTASGVSIGRNNNGASAATTIVTDGGNILMRGKSTGANPSMGIHFAHSGTLDAGSGTLTMIGQATNYSGIELSAWVNGMLNISAYAVNIQGKTSNNGFHGLATSELAGQYTSITAGAGGITLYGENTGAGTSGIQQAANLVTSNGGDIVIESPDTFWFYNAHNAHTYNAGSGDITIRANGMTNSGVSGVTSFTGTGSLTIEPYSNGTSIGIAGGAGTLSVPASFLSTNFADGFSSITIGNATAGAIEVGGAATFRDNATLRSNSTIALNGAVTANENLTLTSAGAINQNAALQVTGTTTITAGSGNDVTLSNTGNDFTGAVSVVSAKNLQLVDSNAMTLGAVNAAGTVDAATGSNNLTLTGAIATTDTGSSAVVLNAGKDTAAGTSTGGNIIISGGSVTAGAGGRVTLYSGDISDSTGLTALVGSGSGNFRYNSDESVSNFSTPLGSGIYAVYREQVTTDAPLAPATPATENQTVDTVVMSLTSIQPSVNGTQETSSGDSGATSGSLPTEGGYAMGPGAGSGSIDMFSVFELIEDRTL